MTIVIWADLKNVPLGLHSAGATEIRAERDAGHRVAAEAGYRASGPLRGGR